MKRSLVTLIALGLAASSHAQLWNGDSSLSDTSLPPSYPMAPSYDSYFTDGGALSEFDMDVGQEFSLQQYGTKPANIDPAHGWQDASVFAPILAEGDKVTVTYLGKTAGWLDDFGMNLGGTNAYGGGGSPYTLWSAIDNGSPGVGSQYSFTADSAGMIDFWLNSSNSTYGGTYSVFYPGTSKPSNSGLPDYDFSAFGKGFNVYDNIHGVNRSILVLALEDWRSFDADFTDIFFAIELTGRDGGGFNFPVPEPSTYGLIGAMMLLGLVAVRRSRR